MRPKPESSASTGRAMRLSALLRHPWTRSGSLLSAAVLSAASIFSSPSGLDLALGLAGPLIPLWLLGAGYVSMPRFVRWHPGRQLVVGGALTSVALPPLLALAGAGGLIGGGLFDALETLLGRGGAVFVLLLVATSGGLLMLGRNRERIALALAQQAARRHAGNAADAAVPPRRPEQAARIAPPRTAVAEVANRSGDTAPQPAPELVIVGSDVPPSLSAGPSPRRRGERQKATERPVVATAAPRPAAVATLPSREGAEERPPARQWALPALDVLSAGKAAVVAADDLKAQARVIEETLETFRLPVRVVEVHPGPVLSLYGVEPGPGVAVDRIAARAHDLALRLGARTVRVQVSIPGRTLMGIEVPHGETSLVSLRETLESAAGHHAQALPVGLGKDVSGQAVVVDLARLPHLLIAGATGSGKSVGLNTLLMSLLLTRTPEEVKFILIDPKRVELVPYTGVPHLRMPVVTDMERVLGVLRWALAELESRFSRFAAATCRNLEAYNQRRGGERLPRLVIVIDELADLMMTVPDEVERCLVRLAQLGRAAGIHLVIATQRPSVDVLTGLIKANFPARIAFAVSSLMDSRVVLDAAGAEQLLGRGDMLYQAPDAGKPRRIQGAYADERELREVVSHWRRQGAPTYSPAEEDELASLGREALADPEDELFGRAQELAAEHERVTASFLQRRLNIGYPKAARLMQRLQELAEAEEDE